jgi:hypothetical protein
MVLKTIFSCSKSNKFIEKYGKTSMDQTTIYRNVGTEIANATVENGSVNDKKVEFIKNAFIFLVLGILMNFIFLSTVVYIIYTDP